VGSDDEVRLAVPARPEFVGLARVTAAGLASRLGFTFDQVEDLRLAIDEMCFGLTGTVHGEGNFSPPGPVHLSELSKVILDALVDEHSISDGADGPRFRLMKKRERKKIVVDELSLGEVSEP